VVVVPAASATEAVQLATEKVARENRSRADLRRGKLLRDVYRKYGVL